MTAKKVDLTDFYNAHPDYVGAVPSDEFYAWAHEQMGDAFVDPRVIEDEEIHAQAPAPSPRPAPETTPKNVTSISRAKSNFQELPPFLESRVHLLNFDKAGRLKPTPLTVETILRYDPAWAGAFRLNRRFDIVSFSGKYPFSRGAHETDVLHADNDIHRMRAWFGAAYYMTPGADVIYSAACAIAAENSFDPVRDYFEALQWDGVKRIDDFLQRLAGAPAKPIYSTFARKWLISAVARTYSPGCKADHMLILIGRQGTGKSTLFSTLAGRDFFSDRLSDISDKDAQMELRGPLIVEMAELENLNRKSTTAIKAFLSIDTDRYRAPYARATEQRPRMCVFAGTTNHSEFSRDTTGARRFWPVPTGEIDTDAIAAERDQLWAEAVAAYKSGEVWHLDDAEAVRMASAEQAAVRVAGELDEQIRNYLIRPLKSFPPDFRWTRCFLPDGRRRWVSVREIMTDMMGLSAEAQMHRGYEVRQALEAILGTVERGRRRMSDGSRERFMTLSDAFWDSVLGDEIADLQDADDSPRPATEDDLDPWYDR